MFDILVLHGPNLNLLGMREPERYGETTLSELNQSLIARSAKAGFTLECAQSNSEATLIDLIHQAKQKKCKIIIFNPAAFTHTSIALRDALLAVDIPFIEAHVSNIQSREPYRQISYFSDIAMGVISGLGSYSYELALAAACQYLTNKHTVN